MDNRDIVIVGGGMAGSTLAAMLGQRGIDTILVDPHDVYPPDFRCEKLDQSQIALLDRTGLSAVVKPVTETTNQIWICRRGRVVEKRPAHQINARYDALVNAARSSIGGSASIAIDKVSAIASSEDRQEVRLASGATLSARLVILATGLNVALRNSLGFGRQDIARNHTMCVGFDLLPVGRDAFPFSALTAYPDDTRDRIAYLTLFPFGNVMRANLFLYRDKDDPWLRALRDAPLAALKEVFPRLHDIVGAFTIPPSVQIRPTDLYITTGRDVDGVVLVGDASGTSCPAAGTGFNKVLTDAVRLADMIPGWLRTPGMAADKIAAFYTDPEKVAADEMSLERAALTRKVATENSLRWRARRLIRYAGQVAVGAARGLMAGRSNPVLPAQPGERR